MTMDRRSFLQVLGAGAAGGSAVSAGASSETDGSALQDGMGVLVDTTVCIGCRKCEFACNREHELSDKPLEDFEDASVMAEPRRMEHDSYTVVNQYPNPKDSERPIYVKMQCMHCLEPACVSACLVGALQRQENGAITYDAWKCIGCRYCMVACPFQVPAYEYHKALTPRVRKCVLCFERISRERAESNGKAEEWIQEDIFETAQKAIPACAEMCPPQALTFGKRSELLALAHEKIEENPEKYVPRVYGERIVGGTAWLYLSAVPFEDLGLLELGDKSIPPITESLQHSIFRYGVPPLLGFVLLGAAMKVFKDEEDEKHAEEAPDSIEGGLQ
jgi:formate dehydrogenase iron-sulfur subunit